MDVVADVILSNLKKKNIEYPYFRQIFDAQKFAGFGLGALQNNGISRSNYILLHDLRDGKLA